MGVSASKPCGSLPTRESRRSGSEGIKLGDTIGARGPLWQRFWEPLTLAVLNTTPERGAAQLLWRAMAKLKQDFKDTGSLHLLDERLGGGDGNGGVVLFCLSKWTSFVAQKTIVDTFIGTTVQISQILL